MTKIKICGLTRPQDIAYVNEVKPDYIGFILLFPKSRRNLTPDQAAALRKELDPAIRAVGVFVNQPAETVLKAAKSVGLDVIQLHGQEDAAYLREIQSASGLPVWKAFHIRTPADLEDTAASPADAVLLDNGCGTGEAFDWTLAESFRRPFFLAGGLTPDNISEAVHTLHPALVDLSSGVETAGYKDLTKIRAAVKAAHTS